MDSTASYGGAGYEVTGCEFFHSDVELSAHLLSAREKRLQNRPEKKRHRALRKNRKPSRPTGYIGRRTNNRLLHICSNRRLLENEQAESLE